MASAIAVAGWAEDEWEPFDDNGFVYKRLKRLNPPSTTPDPTAVDSNKRKRRKKALLKLKHKYEDEVSRWELLSNTLRVFEKEAEIRVGEACTSSGRGDGQVGLGEEREVDVDLGLRRRIDELAVRVDADHAVIQGVSDLCDVAEAICSAQEQELKKQYLDLPIFESPRKMMKVLCDTQSESDNGD